MILKKTTALFFITLFLFNLFGYRFVFTYMQQKVSDQLEVKLDKSLYSDADLIELKVPMNLPYQTNWSAYQRYNGEIEMDGIMYKYVKRKVSNDTLYLMCIPNTKKMTLETAKNDFFKMSNDLTQNNNSKKSDNSKTISFKILQGEYDQYSFALHTVNPYENNMNSWPAVDSESLISSPHVSPEQPPDQLGA
ncbi:hypothetical protein FW778_15625 [Ginsengibacter hankyongi]|uniref:Uncharacterized protein n=1 Tax=Ginsengibacter hankyongi TaxID=2607284 RepID=A0A5J5IF88_9BACT|nr:hypothetical protein [Ginsengibacter hankyongi]KAA9038178.1 hypothetical protein FW778_15625 [Ginsengibacter hankyongi]